MWSDLLEGTDLLSVYLVDDIEDENCIVPDLTKKKLEAVKAGMHTDCAFLVGSNDETAELLHACSADLKIASDFFRAMFETQWNENSDSEGVRRMKQTEPRIFKMLIEYTHVHTLIKKYELEDIVLLAVAADHFLVPSLVDHCSQLIEKMIDVESIWQTLNVANHILTVTNACSKVLSEKTVDCLEHPSFLQAKPESLVCCLRLDVLTITSEMVLVNACIKLANESPDNAGQIIKSALPHLRLLTLQNEDISILSEYLSTEEKFALGCQMLFKEETAIQQLDNSLCLTKEQRKNSISTLEVIPKHFIPRDIYTIISMPVYTTKDSKEFELKFTAKKSLCIIGVEVITQVKQLLDFKPVKHTNWFEEVHEGELYNEDVEIVVSVQASEGLKKDIGSICVIGDVQYNTVNVHRFKEKLYIAKGMKCTIKTYIRTSFSRHPEISKINIQNHLSKFSEICDFVTNFEVDCKHYTKNHAGIISKILYELPK